MIGLFRACVPAACLHMIATQFASFVGALASVHKLSICGVCSVVFPGRMSIGQGNEESMGIWWTRLIQVTWNDSIDQGVLTETRILQIRRLVDFAWRSSTNGLQWSNWQPCRYHSINYCLFVTVWLFSFLSRVASSDASFNVRPQSSGVYHTWSTWLCNAT